MGTATLSSRLSFTTSEPCPSHSRDPVGWDVYRDDLVLCFLSQSDYVPGRHRGGRTEDRQRSRVNAIKFPEYEKVRMLA